MSALTDEDKVIRNDVGKRIAAAIEALSAPEAEKVSYDNTESGMTADNAQDAIDELKSDIDSVKLEDLDDVNLTSLQDEDELHYDSATSKWKNIAKKIYEKSASGSLVSFNDGGDNIPLKSLIANITAVQSGSGTPSPSNVRAISGFSACNLYGTGSNIWGGEMFADSFANTNGYTKNTTTKTFTFRNAQYAPYDDTLFSGVFKPNTQYTIIWRYTAEANNNCVRVEYTDGTVTTITMTASSSKVTYRTVTAANKTIKRVYIGYYSNGLVTIYYDESGLFEGDVAESAFEPFGTTHNIPFGQTVYGGTLDVLSGVLTVTHTLYNLGDYTWVNEGNGVARIDGAQYDLKFQGSVICSIYNGGSTQDGGIYVGNAQSYPLIRIKDATRITSETTAEQIKTLVTGGQVAFELYEPTTIQLTPAQVSTLLGLNNIFADTGDISLSYFTQNANAINDIAESNTRTALNTDVPKTDLTDIFVTGTKNNTGVTISAGTYFYVNGQLALCKQAISANADLTFNTNYELVTAGALNKLMSNVNTSLASKIESVYSHHNWTNSHAFSVSKPATYLLFTDTGADMASLKIFADNVATLYQLIGTNIQSVNLNTSTMEVTVAVNNKGLVAIRIL